MKKQDCKLSLIMIFLMIIIISFTSCIHEDIENCGITINFDYSYNIRQTNNFGPEVEKAGVWIFDKNGVFVSQYEEEGDHIQNDYVMRIPLLSPGEYTLVGWARGRTRNSELANFRFPLLTPGSSVIDDLNPRLQRENDVCNTELNSLLNGVYHLDLRNNESVHCTINMLKCINKLRIILKPYRDEKQLDVENFGFRVEGGSGWLNYRAERYQDDAVIYIPYYTENLHDSQMNRPEEQEDGNGAFAELNTSRIFNGTDPRLRISSKLTGKELLDLDLTRLLTQQAIGEHNDLWDNQEYLDRQDVFTITFFVDDETFMLGRILVNGWVVSMKDIEL